MTDSNLQQLLLGLDNATAMVDEMLESSFATREQYRCERDSALSSYIMDIGSIDEEFELVTAGNVGRRHSMAQASRRPTMP